MMMQEGVKGTNMHTCDGRMVDEPCMGKSFLENWWIQQLETQCTLVDGNIFIWTSKLFMFVGTM
jgi:hypothetical protein